VRNGLRAIGFGVAIWSAWAGGGLSAQQAGPPQPAPDVQPIFRSAVQRVALAAVVARHAGLRGCRPRSESFGVAAVPARSAIPACLSGLTLNCDKRRILS